MIDLISQFSPTIIIGGLSLYIGFIVKNMLPAYFNEKGKNLATKEDISEITDLVESVKAEYIKENEFLKSNLNFLTNLQIGIASEERNAIIDYNSKYFNLFHLLSNNTLRCREIWNFKEVSRAYENLESIDQDFQTSRAKLKLWIEDETLLTSADALFNSTFFNLQVPALQFIYVIQNNSKSIDYYDANPEKTKRDSELRSTCISNCVEAHLVYSKHIEEKHNEVEKMAFAFQAQCRSYLKSRGEINE